MIFVFAFIPVSVVLFAFAVLYWPKHSRKHKAEPMYTIREPFSVPDYLSRRERECLKLLEEREQEEPYIITLWWGFDGLRLNADGTTEWISRRAEPAPKSNDFPALANLQAIPGTELQTQMYGLQGAERERFILERQLLSLHAQCVQTAQAQYIIGALQPPPYPQYLAYTPNYIHSIQQTCCGGPC